MSSDHHKMIERIDRMIKDLADIRAEFWKLANKKNQATKSPSTLLKEYVNEHFKDATYIYFVSKPSDGTYNVSCHVTVDDDRQYITKAMAETEEEAYEEASDQMYLKLKSNA